MKKISVVSVKKPSNSGGAEIVWENFKKQGMNFENISLDNKDLPKFYKILPNVFHLKEIFTSKWLIKKAINNKSDIIIYDKIFGWPNIKTNAKKICYNHGSYTIAGLTFKKKSRFIYIFYKYILSYFEKKSYKNADKIIAVSDSVKNEMISYFGVSKKKIVVINNSVNLKLFKSMKNKKKLRMKYGLPQDKKIIFFPGRASYGKGFDIAENVLKKLDENYFMFVLGEGKSKIKNIKFIGKIDNEKMPEVYNAADICLFPSRYEGSSVSVLESAACGVPLVLSKVGEMKTNKKMQEFVSESIEEYVNKIKNINLGNASKKWIAFSKDFFLEHQLSELENFLKK